MLALPAVATVTAVLILATGIGTQATASTGASLEAPRVRKDPPKPPKPPKRKRKFQEMKPVLLSRKEPPPGPRPDRKPKVHRDAEVIV
jgi:hypothetical protein